MAATKRTEQRLEALALRAQDRLRVLRADFDEAWNKREFVRALNAFQRFHDELAHHLSWEEEPLAAAAARRDAPADPSGAKRHHHLHTMLQKLCVDLIELLARRIWMGGCVDDDIQDRLSALDQLHRGHQLRELGELRAALGGRPGDAELAWLERGLDDAGAVRTPAG